MGKRKEAVRGNDQSIVNSNYDQWWTQKTE